MKVLFVCKYNKFRSKVAEAITHSLSSAKIELKSAGINSDLSSPFVSEKVVVALKEKGYELINEKSRKLNPQDIIWADKIIVVANNLSIREFPKDKTEQWKVADCADDDKECISDAIEVIELRVKNFLKTFKY